MGRSTISSDRGKGLFIHIEQSRQDVWSISRRNDSGVILLCCGDGVSIADSMRERGGVKKAGKEKKNYNKKKYKTETKERRKKMWKDGVAVMERNSVEERSADQVDPVQRASDP